MALSPLELSGSRRRRRRHDRMARVIVLGATGSLGRHVVSGALAAGHHVTVAVRSPAKLTAGVAPLVAIHAVDLAATTAAEVAGMVSGHDALINCAGHVRDSDRFAALVDRIVSGVERLPPPRPPCWLLAGAALLDIDASGRRGVDLPRLRSTYQTHGVNFDRLLRSRLDWRLLCPGPMVEGPSVGLERLRISMDRLPVPVGRFAGKLPAPLLLALFASLVPQMIVPYADAAALMLADLEPGSEAARRRVGLALPAGMRGHKSRWAAPPSVAATTLVVPREKRNALG